MTRTWLYQQWTANSMLPNLCTSLGRNNILRLKCAKTKEIAFWAKQKRSHTTQIPPPCEGIEWVSSLTVLGVVINDWMTAADRVSSLLTSCWRLLYALHVLRHHGISAASVNDVFRSTVLAKPAYWSPAWSGFGSAADSARLESLLRRCQQLGYCDHDMLTLSEMFDDADDNSSIVSWTIKLIRCSLSYLQDESHSQYNLRTA